MSDKPTTAHNAVTLALSKKEHAEHMQGMLELRNVMQQRPLQIRAYQVGDPHAPATAKTVHFVRHGQGFHNFLADLAHAAGRTWEQFVVSPSNPYTSPEILDAPLTEKGRQQARSLQSRIQALPQAPQLVVLSPTCRALQTGVIAWEHSIGIVPFLAHEDVREECGVHTCDQRRPVCQQKAEFPQVDFSLLQSNEDPLFQNDHRETKRQVGERIYNFLVWLSEREEQHVAVNSHSGWLLTLFNGVVECMDSQLHEWWQTGEMRSVKLEFYTPPSS